MQRNIFEDDRHSYRETVREFLAREVEPNYERWESERLIDRSAWISAGKSGILGLAIPEEYGGSGVTDYRFRTVVVEEVARTATTSFGSGISTQDDIVIPYIAHLGTEEQKQRWLPGLAAGEFIGAIAGPNPEPVRTCKASRPPPSATVTNGYSTDRKHSLPTESIVTL